MKIGTQKIIPCLAFNYQAEEAVNFYVSIFSTIFENTKVLNIARYNKEELEALSYLPEDIRPGTPGSVRTIRFLPQWTGV